MSYTASSPATTWTQQKAGAVLALLLSCTSVSLIATTPANADWLSYDNQVTGDKIRLWANDGGEKVPREEIRAIQGNAIGTTTGVWNGTTIDTFGARNEIVSFSVIVENNGSPLTDVSVNFDKLTNSTFTLETTNNSSTALFNWTDRPIEVFTVDYLNILGLSRISYDLYDETHIPKMLRRPYTHNQPITPAVGVGGWEDRPDHNRAYPDIAIPQEAKLATAIESQSSQIFWVDIYLPKDTPAGTLSGSLELAINGATVLAVPVEVQVLDFTLSDERTSKTMLYIEASEIKERYFSGVDQPLEAEDHAAYRQVVDEHFKLAWRHGISLIDANELLPDGVVDTEKPNVDWVSRLTGQLYTSANGYAGPGKDLPHDVFSIGTYGAWTYWWQTRQFHPLSSTYDPDLSLDDFQSIIESQTNAWETWFQTNAPHTERFLFVQDEPSTTAVRSYSEQVSGYVANNPGVGSQLDTFVTSNAVLHGNEIPSATILGAQISVAPTVEWDLELSLNPQRKHYFYNGRRPASGTFATEDDGVALRELAWAQHKKGVDRWFYWHATYYDNFQGGQATRDLSQVDINGGENFRLGTQTNVFKSAHTFGGHSEFSPIVGETGGNYGNGDGVLFYPGTDVVFPDSNLNIAGPIASLRLKHWRRGIQDVQYIAMANRVDAATTQAIVQSLAPEVLWEIGVHEAADPTYVHKPPSWPTDSDVWEAARYDLAQLILSDVCAANNQTDSDRDGICDNADNCTNAANSQQIDVDGDGFGNRCDADFDNNCGVDFGDYLAFRNAFQTTSALEDLQVSGAVDFQDFLIFRQLFQKPPGPSATAQICQ